VQWARAARALRQAAVNGNRLKVNVQLRDIASSSRSGVRNWERAIKIALLDREIGERVRIDENRIANNFQTLRRGSTRQVVDRFLNYSDKFDNLCS